MVIFRRNGTFISFSQYHTGSTVGRPCEGVAGAMLASRVVCKVVQITVKQRQLHANICNGDASWEPGASNCGRCGKYATWLVSKS